MIKLNIRLLKLVSLCYLILPVFVFFLTWVKVWIGLPVVLLLFYVSFRYSQSLTEEKAFEINRFYFFGVLLLALLWLSYSGVGGFGIKIHDHYKIYCLAKDISENAWPVSYQFEGKNYFLSSYLGYFISAPVLVGWISYKAIHIFLFLYGFLALIIGLLWLMVLTGVRAFWAVVIFIFVGGFDVAGYIFRNGLSFLEGMPQFYWWNSLNSNDYLLYHGNSNLLFWAAPHALPAWVASGVFFYDLLKKKEISWSPVYLFPLVFWTPFILVGLLPFFALKAIMGNFRRLLKIDNFLLLIPTFLLVWFVTSVGVAELDQGNIFRNVASKGQFLQVVFNYSWFVLFEVLIWFVIVYLLLKNSMFLREHRIWFGLSLLVLMALPLYKLGKYNDWVQRVSMPSLFLLWIWLIRGIKESKSYLKYIAILLIAVSSADSLTYWITGLKESKGILGFNPLKIEEVKSMPQAAKENDWPIEQYLAPADASFFKYVAKQSE
ncbi:hypothetical protein [Jiulongibacter sediminis]|jgi:hypothetical protein|uniref:hypothetical protein n=1 Tax=Jiulongibacter sediminis TaxID=1605367 RepID=UPI0026E9F78B|nr:hypothetical protein [Jiulongibacter sediminis]